MASYQTIKDTYPTDPTMALALATEEQVLQLIDEEIALEDDYGRWIDIQDELEAEMD